MRPHKPYSLRRLWIFKTNLFEIFSYIEKSVTSHVSTVFEQTDLERNYIVFILLFK